MAKDGGGGCFVIWARRIALRQRRSGLSLLPKDITMANPHFRPTFLDRITQRRFRNAMPRGQETQFDDILTDILTAEAPFLTDRVTQGHIVFASCVLAAQRVLTRAGCSDEETTRTLRDLICGTGKRSKTIVMLLIQRLSRDPFETYRSYTKHQLPQGYGPSFSFVYDEGDDHFTSQVTTCGFQAFLSRHHATALLPLFCEWDKIWITALPDSIRFSRPYTLATGGPACPFRFERKGSADGALQSENRNTTDASLTSN